MDVRTAAAQAKLAELDACPTFPSQEQRDRSEARRCATGGTATPIRPRGGWRSGRPHTEREDGDR
eukprot:8357295-Pyramimonas_sp.AAC.1